MKKIFALSLNLLLTAGGIFSQTTSPENTGKFAGNFFAEKYHNFSGNTLDGTYYSYFVHNSDEGEPLFYVFNMKPQGFIIISAQLNAFPVLCYSFYGKYESGKSNPGFSYFLNLYSKQIKDISSRQLPPDEKTARFWKRYLDYSIDEKNIANEKSVSPLLTSKWNQDKYYNEFCPSDVNGPGGHAYAGCVATALGQLMYYYRWPESGTGSYIYTHPVYGLISADFSSAAYIWDEMVNSLTTYNTEVAELLFHLGVSVDMDYGPNGSGMWNHKGAYTLKTYFKYGPQTRYIFRDSTTLSWDSVVIANLDNKKPLYYAGWEDTTFTSGHAFVCDGYQATDFFHFNWGWGGYYDGYFYLNQLNPGGANFNLCQELIADIYPDTMIYSYPAYCSGNNTFVQNSGTFTDGSSVKDYLPDSDCSWAINPDCGAKVRLVFDRFSVSGGDTVTVLDGISPGTDTIVSYVTGNQPVTTEYPQYSIVESTTNNMYINFTSNGTDESDGFKAAYSVVFCNVDTLTEMSGTVVDGSGNCDYNNSLNCRWHIINPIAQYHTIIFTYFDLAADNTGDYIKIYKNSIVPGNLIATLDHANPPSAQIEVFAPVAAIRFVTNAATQAGGWSFDYHTITVGSENKYYTRNNDIKVYPNPVTDDFTVRFKTVVQERPTLELMDIYGKTVCITENYHYLNNSEIKVSGMVENISQGYYILRVKTGGNIFYHNVIKTD